MYYINTKQGGAVETVDEFATIKEAKMMIKEYNLSAPYMGYYISSRATREWRGR